MSNDHKLQMNFCILYYSCHISNSAQFALDHIKAV